MIFIYKYSPIRITLLVILFVISLCACSKLDDNEEVKKQIETANSTNIGVYDRDSEGVIHNDDKAIQDFLVKFIAAIKCQNTKAFKALLDKDGILSISYFGDKRDRNVVIRISRDQVRDDLVLANSEKIGITLETMFSENIINLQGEIPIHKSEFLSNISFNVDWHTDNERNVQKKLEDIVNTCKQIILTNNHNIPQLFVLKDNIFVFTQSSIVEEPYDEFTGDWLIFEKIDGIYKLRAVMKFQ